MPDTSGKRSSFLTKITNRYLAVWAKLHGEDSSGNDTKIQTETDGELKSVFYGKETDASVLTAVRTETTTGELHTILNGKDSGGNVDPLRTNENQQLQVEVVNNTNNIIIIDPALIPTSDGILATLPGVNGTDKYYLWFYICEYEGVEQSITISRDLNGVGTTSASEYILKEVVLPANSIIDWMGPFVVEGADTIRGNDNGASGNGANIRFRVEKKS